MTVSVRETLSPFMAVVGWLGVRFHVLDGIPRNEDITKSLIFGKTRRTASAHFSGHNSNFNPFLSQVGQCLLHSGKQLPFSGRFHLDFMKKVMSALVEILRRGRIPRNRIAETSSMISKACFCRTDSSLTPNRRIRSKTCSRMKEKSMLRTARVPSKSKITAFTFKKNSFVHFCPTRGQWTLTVNMKNSIFRRLLKNAQNATPLKS